MDTVNNISQLNAHNLIRIIGYRIEKLIAIKIAQTMLQQVSNDS